MKTRNLFLIFILLLFSETTGCEKNIENKANTDCGCENKKILREVKNEHGYIEVIQFSAPNAKYAPSLVFFNSDSELSTPLYLCQLEWFYYFHYNPKRPVEISGKETNCTISILKHGDCENCVITYKCNVLDVSSIKFLDE